MIDIVQYFVDSKRRKKLIIMSRTKERMYVARYFACFLLLFVCVSGCSRQSGPVMVKGQLQFGQYILSPPAGYWYFPGKHATKIRPSGSIFLITFWKHKEEARLNKGVRANIGVFFNFVVSTNTYKSVEAYYDAARRSGITYKAIPKEAQVLGSLTDWSCNRILSSVYGIECVSLRDNLITIGAYGKDKGAVISKIPVLQKMIESFRLQKK